MSSSSGFNFARSHSGDRFYNPPMRRHQKQQQLLRQKQEEVIVQTVMQQLKVTSLKQQQQEEKEEIDSSTTSSSFSSSPVGTTTNLDRFLESVTPLVTAQYFSKTSMKEWRSGGDGEFHPYFNLEDLWESYKEWSAYGAGVPVMLNENDCVIQYYVPYLSGIQLYVDPSKPPFRVRRAGEDSDAESPRETSSEGSSVCDPEGQLDHGLEAMWNKQTQVELNRISVNDKVVTGSSSDDGEVCNPPGLLIFQYLERDPPYSREPLADKIAFLSSRFLELKTYKSCDLLPASWISVAWYPIYRIPTGPTLRDLDACFLTFHSLSTPLQSGNCQPQVCSSFTNTNGAVDASVKLSLPVFGLASYKFKGSVWTPNGLDERQQASSLLQAAENWLRLLQIDHPDYRFFVSHNAFRG